MRWSSRTTVYPFRISSNHSWNYVYGFRKLLLEKGPHQSNVAAVAMRSHGSICRDFLPVIHHNFSEALKSASPSRLTLTSVLLIDRPVTSDWVAQGHRIDGRTGKPKHDL